MRRALSCLVFALSVVQISATQPPQKATAQTEKRIIPASPPPSPVAPKWEREPTTVLGIMLGRPLSESAVGSCPAPPETVCIRKEMIGSGPYTREVTSIEGHPLTYVAVGVAFDKDNVAAVTMLTSPDDFDRLMAVLVQRYGSPGSSEIIQVQTKGGAIFPSRQLVWSGERTRIVAVERAGRVDQSHVRFEDITIANEQAAQQQRETEVQGSKL